MNVFITGSTKGIGKAIAIKMMNLGHKVLVSSRKKLSSNDLKKIFNTNKSIEYIKCDISKENDILNVRKFINEKWGGEIDYLVANAGIMPTPSGAFEISNEDIKRTIDVNLIGTFNTVKILGKMIQDSSKDGSIVVLTSVDGIIGEPYGIIYSATKSGIISLTKSFAREFKKPLVRVNAVAPGLINTPLTESTGEDPSCTIDLSIIERMGTSDEIANTIYFLLSKESSFTTGQIITVDGGFTLK